MSVCYITSDSVDFATWTVSDAAAASHKTLEKEDQKPCSKMVYLNVFRKEI